MSKFQDKNILFYRLTDSVSSQFLKELEKNKPLKNQFILINQDDKQISIPERIKTTGESLVLIANGVNELITGKQAIYWLQNNCFSNKSNGFEFCSLDHNAMGVSIQESTMSLIDSSNNVQGSSKYCVIGSNQDQIATYEDQNGGSTRGGNKSEFQQRVERLKAERSELTKQQQNRPMFS